MAAVAQRSMPLQPGAPQLCAARPDPFQQALIVCPPGFQGEEVLQSINCINSKKSDFWSETVFHCTNSLLLLACLFVFQHTGSVSHSIQTVIH